MRTARLALLISAFAATAASAAVTNRSDAGFVFHGPTGPFATEGVSCPGTLIPSLPASPAGNTCTSGATNTITNYGGTCATALPFPYPGPEDIYQFNAGAGANIAFSMSLTGSTGDLALFILDTCNVAANCINQSQDAIGPGAGPETIAATAYAAGDYYVYIDSYYGGTDPARCGTYTLNVTGTLPVELLEFKVD